MCTGSKAKERAIRTVCFRMTIPRPQMVWQTGWRGVERGRRTDRTGGPLPATVLVSVAGRTEAAEDRAEGETVAARGTTSIEMSGMAGGVVTEEEDRKTATVVGMAGGEVSARVCKLTNHMILRLYIFR